MNDEAWEVPHGGPPTGLDVRVDADVHGVCLWIDPPPRRALMREAIAPPLMMALFAAVLCMVTLQTVRTRSAVLVVILAFGVWRWFKGLADLILNAGIVTRIDVRDGWLSWRKKTLWGESEQRWEVRTITDVTVKSFMLKIHRRTGVPLGAFAYRKAAHLDWLCGALRSTIDASKKRTA